MKEIITQWRLMTLLMLALAARSSSERKVKTQDDYFNLVYSKDYVYVIVCDSDSLQGSCALAEKLLKDLEAEPIIKEYKTELRYLDTKEIPFIREAYKITQPIVGFDLIKHQLKRMEFMDEYTQDKDYEQLKARALSFIEYNYKRLGVKLESEEEFKDAVKKHKIIALYLGQEDQFLQNYKDFAAKHIDFDFYYVTDNEISNKIFVNMVNDNKPEEDIMAIVRDKELITEYDT